MPTVNLVFVHGFLSGPDTWNPLWEQLKKIESIRSTVVEHRFEYSSPGFQLSPSSQIPEIKQIAEALATYLDKLLTSPMRNPTVLVGHSQGGLVIQAMLAHRLHAGAAKRLLSISHCVLIATPTNGSEFLNKTRGFLARVFGDWNPQEKRLRPLDDYIAELQRTVAQSVIYANSITDHSCPIPFTAIYGTTDGIVQPQSVRWIFPLTEAVSGDHFTVIRPPSSDAPLCVVLERIVGTARYHLPADTSLICTVPLNPGDTALLQDCLALHSKDFTPSQAIRKSDAEHWLPLYEHQFGIRLRMIAGMVDGQCRGFLMFHEDPRRNLAVVDYLVSRDENELDQFAIRKLLSRLRDSLRQSGVQYFVFEVARPIQGTATFKTDVARVRKFEGKGARVIPQMGCFSPSMTASFDKAGEEPTLLMVGTPEAVLTTITWAQVGDFVSYIFGTWYRNWFSNRSAADLYLMETYLDDLKTRVLATVPTTGSATLPERFKQ